MKKQITVLFIFFIIFLLVPKAFSCIDYSENLTAQILLVNKTSVKYQNKVKQLSKCKMSRNKNCSLQIKEVKKAEEKYKKEKAILENLKGKPTDSKCQ
jgi:hypothetical protein